MLRRKVWQHPLSVRRELTAEGMETAFAVNHLAPLVLHPRVVRAGLGDRPGPVGWLLSRIKGRWESPEVCAERMTRILRHPRWSAPGDATWMVEEEVQPWPAAAEDPATRRAVREATARWMEGIPSPGVH
jgi:hypothetical protein